MIDFIFQPNDKIRLGDLLISELSSDNWQQFIAVIAFVKRSGVKHIQKSLREFSRKGFVEIVIGIDQEGTTEEGLLMLLDALEERGKVYVFHNRNNSTFHPKIYFFMNEQSGKILLGSNNLTEGGLFTNYEAAIAIDLDFNQENDRQVANKVKSAFEIWVDIKSGLAIVLTSEVLKNLVDMKIVPTENQVRKNSIEKIVKKKGQDEVGLLNLSSFFLIKNVPKAPVVAIDDKYIKPGEEAIDADEVIEEQVDTGGNANLADSNQTPPTTGEIDDVPTILVKYVPKAGNRTSQVHFTLGNMTNYFHLRTSQAIRCVFR